MAEPPLTGLRGFAALGERLDSEPGPQGRSPGARGSVASEPRDLADALADVLRQEALRHGIDPRQGLA